MLNKINYPKLFLNLNIIFIIGLFLYSLTPSAFSYKQKNSYFSQHIGEKIVFQAEVCQEPEYSYKNQKISLCAGKERVLVYSSLYPRYKYGQILEVEGRVTAIENFSDFNYIKHLEVKNIFAVLYYPKISVASDRSNHQSLSQSFKSLLIFIRQKGQQSINTTLPEPEASLASAMLFGYKRSLDQEDLNAFSDIGLSHLLAISGAHIAILAAILQLIFSRLLLGRKTSFLLISVFLISYPLATGLSSSAVRAALMGFFTFLASFLGRQKQAIRILIISASIMLISNPMLLVYDLAFQLSFSAVIGIIIFENKLSAVSNRLIERSYKNHYLQKIYRFIFSLFNLSIAAQIFTWPIIILNFQKLPLISVFTNVFLAWTLPFILAFLLIAISLSFVFPALSSIFFWPSYILISFIFFVSDFLLSLNFPMLELRAGTGIYLILYYIVLLFIVFKQRRKNKKRL